MEKCFDKGWPVSAAKIAVALADKDPESARKAMEKCFDKGWSDSAAKIAVALADKDPESARKAMEKCFDKGWPLSAAKIAVALNDLESARKAMEKCFDKGWLASAGEIAVALNDLESARKAMEKCFDEGRPDSAAKIAVALADKDPESARKAMEKCFDEGWPDSAGEIAVALADKDPESARKAMEKCFDEGLPDFAAKIAVALARNFKFLPETKRLVESINKSQTGFYGEKIVFNLLTENQDLALFKKEYLPKYLFIKELAQEINNSIEESKKWENPEEFFDQHDSEIANLQLIDLNLSTQLLKTHLSRGLSFLSSYLNVFKPALNNFEISQSIKKYIKTNKNLDGINLSDLLEISSAYLNLGVGKQLTKTINESKAQNFKELKLELNKKLLESLAESLNLKIKTKIPEQEISNWKIKYLANLITNQEMIKNTKNEDALRVYNSLLQSIFENRFDDFITNLNQEDEIGREIARHNQKVKEEFEKLNINWENWLNFKEKGIMTIDTQKKQDRVALFDQFEKRFRQWQEQINKYESELKPSLEKDLARLTQKKKEFDPSKINLNDPNWLKELLPAYTSSLNYLKAKNPDFKLSPEVEESFNHLVETIKTLTQQQKEQTVKKDFIVKLWDRNPKKDMFQGNETHCCIAVGVKETPPGGGLTTLHPETIFQYLIDQGINVAEIIDPQTNDVVAQTWLFVTLDENKKPVLVADNFEVNNRYPAGNNVNRGIRESMFQFLEKYAKACNIEQVVLGAVSTNDVETSDLRTISLPSIKKLGGYFNDEKYYLETLEHSQVYKVK
jgi:hypothetical protein